MAPADLFAGAWGGLAGPGLAALAMAMAVFLLAATVKGTLGIGLPLVAVPLLALSRPSTQAIALMVMPVLVSNAWQVWDSGISRRGVARFMPLIATLVPSTLLTVHLTLALPEATLRAVLAVIVLIAVALLALPLHLQVPPARERLWSAAIGAVSGLMGGVSTLTGPVIISYLLSLRLSREVFVGSISVIYLCGALPLFGAMTIQGRIGRDELLLSTLALAPMALGLALGKRLRGHLSEFWFRRALMAFLVVVALGLILK